ncbi:acetoacetate--CoA ligase [Nakamurella lactea]|uniref:acetoacetate--CoA ligase n=1 Tax=Nakamurella lactea TaxID=459515 RepID=UPI000402A263|nr:acetoacetate--CoA ligase [Nakamurella lactea]
MTKSGTGIAPEILWQPTPERVARAAITDFAGFLADRTGQDFGDYAALWEYSTTDLPGFWGALADYFGVRWVNRPQAVLPDASMPGARWFPGGTLNYAEHALAAIDGRADGDLAVIVTDEGDTEELVTLGQLRQQVARAQAGLRRAGVVAGDRVVALAPNGIHALVAFLATAASGAVWSSCSPDFGPASVIDRFTQIEPTVFIAVDGYRYGGKEFDTGETVARVRAALPGLSATVIVPTLGRPLPAGTTGWDEFTAEIGQPAEIDYVPVDFEAPLWVLYSSGTTGLPKPIVQSVGGILLEHLKMLRLHSDLGPGDRFLWFTTTGWMMWNYLVGGLLVGSTIVLYDGNPGYPDLLALWRLAERHRVTYFGTSAPFISSCRAKGLTPSDELDLTSVVAVGSTGSPLSTDGFRWIMEHVGPRVQICSVSGGTDLCTAIVGAAPTVPVWMGEISCRALGARVEAFDEQGGALIGDVGELVLTAPMPSMPVSFWGDDGGSKLRAAYFDDYPGVWRHGDWIRITSRGSCVIEGRSDATLNRGGVRMGTAEFYRVAESDPGVLDSLVIDTSDASGEGDLLLFVVLAGGADLDAVTARVRAAIRSELSPRHVPGTVIAVPSVPRTLNGKKCEVPVKRILAGMPVDTAVSKDALADPAGLDAFLAAARSAK